jgi:hypothetical protein
MNLSSRKNPDGSAKRNEVDDVLRRMLSTPPEPHEPKKAKRKPAPKPKQSKKKPA